MLVVQAKMHSAVACNLPRGMCNEWAWQLGGAVNENAVSRKQRMRENRQQ